MMEQLEFENCIEKMKRRREEGDIKTAAKIADKIPWDEVDDINVLMFAANIYEEAEHYKDAKAILEYAYEIAPVKNRLYYSLSLIYVKCKELKDAVNYYIDFCDAFPEDNRKLLLKYYILKAKGASYDQQKRILDEYVKEDKDEKMIFELALISDKLGEKQEVTTYCDYIINFFGVKKNGYGKNALLLKRKYVPLSVTEEKLLENADMALAKEEDSEYEYKELPVYYNDTRMEEDKRDIPVEKVERITNIEEQNKLKEIQKEREEDITDDFVQNKLNISYTPDEESYAIKEKNEMAFMNGGENQSKNKEKIKKLINKLKEEEKLAESEFNRFRQESFKLKERFKEMKLSETKLHMVIEAHSKDEGIEIAQKELGYIHDVLNEKVAVAKASAYNMNEKGFSYYVDKIKGRDLIIENAGKLKNEIIDEIEEFIINKRGKTIFALVDVINNFDKLASERPTFINRFDVFSVLSNRPQETLDVTKEEIEEMNGSREKKVEQKREAIKETVSSINKKSLSIEEFIEECKYYAKSIDCFLSGEAISALYEKAEEMQDEKVLLTRDSAAALIEEAADRAEKPKMFSKPKYDKDDRLIITEEHFKF